jgi:hypothetical protein
MPNRLTNYKTENYDVDLTYGCESETLIAEIFSSGPKVEVKTERTETWNRFGNIAIEFRYKKNPSGISTTNANHWIHLLDFGDGTKGGFLLPVEWLKKRVKELLKSGVAIKKDGGDNNDSELILIPIQRLFI